jgi:AcrR family transcriptional regulator
MGTAEKQVVSRRERRKHETGVRIKKAATKLFKKYGFENVTIAQIAETADIDPTTFWRHYRSKLEILCSDQESWTDELNAALANIPNDRPIVDAAIEALMLAQPMGQEDMAEIRLQFSHTSPSAETRAALRAIEEVMRAELAKALAGRMNVQLSEDPRPHVLSGAIVGATRWYSEYNLNNNTEIDVKTGASKIGDILRASLTI